jgi:hypothetical protein
VVADAIGGGVGQISIVGWVRFRLPPARNGVGLVQVQRLEYRHGEDLPDSRDGLQQEEVGRVVGGIEELRAERAGLAHPYHEGGRRRERRAPGGDE